MTEGRKDGMTEGRNDGMTERGNTICPSHFMAGHKKGGRDLSDTILNYLRINDKRIACYTTIIIGVKLLMSPGIIEVQK